MNANNDTGLFGDRDCPVSEVVELDDIPTDIVVLDDTASNWSEFGGRLNEANSRLRDLLHAVNATLGALSMTQANADETAV